MPANILDPRCNVSLRTFVLLATNVLLGAAAAAAAGQYTHGPLASALNGRSHEANSVGVADLGVAASAGAAGTESDGGPASGGEVLAQKSFPLSPQEPTCEQLRAMWIFSKRQSRAAEISNEIPTYRDPFAYNVWEPFYSTTRSLGAVRMVPRYGEHSRSPVFGRVVSREPILPQRMSLGRQRHFGDGSSRIYGAESKPTNYGMAAVAGGTQRRPTQNRYVGSNGPKDPNSVVQGSFQKLKELIWTERAKELTQQRRAEEMAARAAVLKEIANGQNVHSPYKHQSPIQSESLLMDENRSPERDDYQHISDERLSIASGQTQLNNNNNNNDNNGAVGKSSAIKATASRRYTNNSNKAQQLHKSIAGSERSLIPSMFGSSYPPNDPHEERQQRERPRSHGIPKSYPARPSHFRERNRLMFKQAKPADYFQREIRNRLKSTESRDNGFDNAIRNLYISLLSKYDPLERPVIKDALLPDYYDSLVEDEPEEPLVLSNDDDDDAYISGVSTYGTTLRYDNPHKLLIDYPKQQIDEFNSYY